MMRELGLSPEETLQLRSLLARWRAARKSKRETRWDFNLVEGQMAESALAQIANSVEVKRDFRWKETGRVFIETGAIGPDGRERDAGLVKSEASHVVFVLDDDGGCGLAMLFERVKLLELAIRLGTKVRGPERSVGYVVPLEALLSAFRATNH